MYEISVHYSGVKSRIRYQAKPNRSGVQLQLLPVPNATIRGIRLSCPTGTHSERRRDLQASAVHIELEMRSRLRKVHSFH